MTLFCFSDEGMSDFMGTMGEIQAFHHLIESAPVFVIGHIGSLLAVFVIEQIFSVSLSAVQ